MKKRKINITFFKKEKGKHKFFKIDKESIELYSEIMRDRYGKV